MDYNKELEYNLNKFNEIPINLFPKIKEIFDKNLNQCWIDKAKEMIEENGLVNWMIPFHFNTGMSIRNLLRNKGITDNLFPDNNLDDYYIPMLEWWLGYR